MTARKDPRWIAGAALSVAVIALGAFALTHRTTPVSVEAPEAAKVGDVRELYSGKLLPDVQVETFSHIDRVFPSRVVARGGKVSQLPRSARTLAGLSFKSDKKTYDLADYLSLNRVSGLLILKDGEVVLEDYELGTDDKTHWVSWSIAKSITSTLVAVALKEGLIKSLDDEVTTYLPELRGSAYAGVTLKNTLQMASGVKWVETYVDPTSDRRHMLDLQIAQQPGTILKFLATLPRAAPAGTVWNYNTGETQLVGALLRAAIHQPLSQYLSEKIWSKLGMESDATWWLESPDGLEIAGSGFGATLRDYGRFGLFVARGGVIDGVSLVPDGWFKAAGEMKTVGGKQVDYGFMWWASDAQPGSLDEGSLSGVGIFGQILYINPKERVVIVVRSARPKPTDRVIVDEDFFMAVLTALHAP